jgi:hypothetical protein
METLSTYCIGLEDEATTSSMPPSALILVILPANRDLKSIIVLLSELYYDGRLVLSKEKKGVSVSEKVVA